MEELEYECPDCGRIWVNNYHGTPETAACAVCGTIYIVKQCGRNLVAERQLG